jgi:hypothetical protein
MLGSQGEKLPPPFSELQEGELNIIASESQPLVKTPGLEIHEVLPSCI